MSGEEAADVRAAASRARREEGRLRVYRVHCAGISPFADTFRFVRAENDVAGIINLARPRPSHPRPSPRCVIRRALARPDIRGRIEEIYC